MTWHAKQLPILVALSPTKMQWDDVVDLELDHHGTACWVLASEPIAQGNALPYPLRLASLDALR
jgi:hypothetical protein